jgi:2-hydroxy-3-keto-5-methylthiopentenyl-1-phosphate phosphatase
VLDPPLDLKSTSVFLDFDGTISTTDIGVFLMERLVGDSWLQIEDLYEQGIIGSRDCILREWSLLRSAGRSLLRSVASEVTVDPGFRALLEGLCETGAEVTVVSDGFGFYVQDALSELGVPVRTAHVDWKSLTITFPFRDAKCPCSECGTCKRTPVEEAASRGRSTVFVGDGNSDRHVAPLVDVLFAKDALARWCEENGIAYRSFSSLGDVARDMGLA